MGIGELYFFTFVVGEIDKDNIITTEVEKLEPEDFNAVEPLKRLWQRIWDENIEHFLPSLQIESDAPS